MESTQSLEHAQPPSESGRIKYPRTHHVPWSAGVTDDDRIVRSLSGFEGRRVIVSEKMDGENTTLYRTGLHARSVDSAHHPSRDWVKSFHAGICADIPSGWRVCGENLFARHSIAYTGLQSYFVGFSIWDERNVCLAWDETLDWFELLGVVPVSVLHDGLYEERALRGLHQPARGANECEGWVMRVAEAFSYEAFGSNVAKFVRAGHVQTSKHWMHDTRIVPNGLAECESVRCGRPRA